MFSLKIKYRINRICHKNIMSTYNLLYSWMDHNRQPNSKILKIKIMKLLLNQINVSLLIMIKIYYFRAISKHK